MKVKLGGGYSPITVVLESKEEADLFWHKFNCSRDKAFNDYLRSKKTEIDESCEESMWLKFNVVYNPKQ